MCYRNLLLVTEHLPDLRAKVGELLPHVTSPKIHLQYAKAKEADGKYVLYIMQIFQDNLLLE